MPIHPRAKARRFLVVLITDAIRDSLITFPSLVKYYADSDVQHIASLFVGENPQACTFKQLLMEELNAHFSLICSKNFTESIIDNGFPLSDDEIYRVNASFLASASLENMCAMIRALRYRTFANNIRLFARADGLERTFPLASCKELVHLLNRQAQHRTFPLWKRLLKLHLIPNLPLNQ